MVKMLRPRVKGVVGEKMVSLGMITLPKRLYRVVNDVMLETDRGTTQIDHIVVSVYGIFVIETKNCKGWIYGDEHSYQWTQKLYDRQHKLFNPIRQNKAHVWALKSVLEEYEGYDDIRYVPLVVFSNQAVLNVEIDAHRVINRKDLLRTIRRFRTPCLSEEDIEEIEQLLHEQNITSKHRRRAHVSQIKRNKRKRSVALALGMCPYCWGRLVKVKGERGKFYGCSNYPSCRFTHPIHK